MEDAPKLKLTSDKVAPVVGRAKLNPAPSKGPQELRWGLVTTNSGAQLSIS